MAMSEERHWTYKLKDQGYEHIGWTKCEKCLAEVDKWRKGRTFKYFSQGGIEHTLACAMRRIERMTINSSPISVAGTYSYVLTEYAPQNFRTPFRYAEPKPKLEKKKKLPIAPVAGKRRIDLD